MATLSTGEGSRLRLRVDFYVVMSIVLVALVVFGFSHTVPDDFATPGFPPFLAAHGIVFAAWMLLFVVQPLLVVSGNTGIHRKLGWAGAAIAVTMVGLGVAAILFGLRTGQVPPFYPHGLFLVRGMVGLLVFASLVAAGFVYRRKPPWHRRLLLCATTVITLPALERSLPLPQFGTGWPFVVDGIADSILLVGPVVDLIARKRVHPAYVFGIGAAVLGQVVTDLIAPSPLAVVLLHAVGAK